MHIQYHQRCSHSGVISVNTCVIVGNLGKRKIIELGCQNTFLLLHFSSMQMCVFSQTVPWALQKMHLKDNLVPGTIFARALSRFFFDVSPLLKNRFLVQQKHSWKTSSSLKA